MKAKILGCFRNLDNPDFVRWIAKQLLGLHLVPSAQEDLEDLEDTIKEIPSKTFKNMQK